MQQRYFALPSLAAIMLILFAACSNRLPLAPPADPAAGGAQAAAANETVTLTFIASQPGPGLDLVQQQVAVWNSANPGIQVEVIAGPQSGTDRYGLYLQMFETQSSAVDVLCLLYTSPSPRDRTRSRMPSSA